MVQLYVSLAKGYWVTFIKVESSVRGAQPDVYVGLKSARASGCIVTVSVIVSLHPCIVSEISCTEYKLSTTPVLAYSLLGFCMVEPKSQTKLIEPIVSELYGLEELVKKAVSGLQLSARLKLKSAKGLGYTTMVCVSLPIQPSREVLVRITV